jgi:phosphoribosylformimino-5-aminoimidazole carboxamide ribotide isomerase
MIVIPAIDLQDGCVVRFVQGKLAKKVYSRDPVKTAKHWARQGAEIIHIVDLDGAFTGVPKNLGLVKSIISEVPAKVEFGGGVRSQEIIEKVLGYGAYRVILGTKAIKDRNFLKRMFAKYGQKVILSLDAKAEKILTEGWKSESGGVDLLDFAHFIKELGFTEVIYTDISKDGTLKGPNIKGIKQLLKATGLKVVASGGVSSLDDLYKLKMLEREGVTSAIVGKALYEGKFTLTQAIKLVH